MRNTWLNTLFEISNKNKKIIFIGSDLGFNVMANFKKKFPKKNMMSLSFLEINQSLLSKKYQEFILTKIYSVI